MMRNLIVIICLFLGIMAMMVLGNVIIVGEKIAQVTTIWWMEYVFYGIIIILIAIFVLKPMWNIHRTPAFPALAIDNDASEKDIQDLGRRLQANCNYISEEKKRREHQMKLRESFLQASGSKRLMLETIRKELTLRYDGDKNLGILGINGEIKEWAKTVFMISAISQNSRFDTISVMWLNYKMIESLVLASGFRPTNRQLFKIYRDILTTALITYAMSEALMKTSAVRPFDYGDLHNSDTEIMSDTANTETIEGNTAEIDPDDLAFDAQVTDSEGLSVCKPDHHCLYHHRPHQNPCGL